MAKKSTFLEMHNAVGGSFSSNERVAELQAYGQKRQEATQKREQKISETRAAKAATAQLAEKQAQSPVRKAATLPNLNLGKNVVSETTQQLLSTAAQRGSETRQKNIPEMEQQIAALQAQKEPLDQYFSAGNSEFDNDGQLTEKAQAQRELNQQLKALQADLDAANQRETVYQRQVAKEESSATPYQDPEFASKSAYASTKTGDGFWDRLASQWRSGVDLPVGYGDLAYEYINNQEEGLRDQIHQQQPNFGYTYDQMTDDEVALYNYYYATGGKEVADNYLKLIEDDLNQRKGAQIAQGLKGKTGSELLFGLGAGLNQFESGVEGAVNLLKGDDSYTAPSAQQYASAAVREDLADSGLNLPGWMGGASLGQAGYDLITNIANMAPSMVVNSLIPGAGTALVGATAAGNAYQEAVNQGYNASQARNYAVASGASEAALQYVLGGISNMGGKVTGHVAEKAISQIKNGVLKAAVEGGINMASEGLEEGIQEVLEPIFAKAFLGSDESVDWEQVAYSAVLGAVSAGVMNLPGTLAGSKADASTDTTIQSPQSQADVQTDVQSDIQPQQANTNMQQQTQDVQPAQGALEAPLQGEPADPRHVAARQERAAQGQQEAVVQSPQTADVDTQATAESAPEVTPATQQKTAMDSMLNGLLPAQQQETTQSPQPTIPDTMLENIAKPQQPTETTPTVQRPSMDSMLDGIGNQQPQPVVDATPVAQQKAAADTVIKATVADSSVKSQIHRSQEMLNSMDVVAEIHTPSQFSTMDKSQKISWVVDKLKPTNYEVNREGFGVIKFAKKQLKSAFNYFAKGGAEEATFEAIPYVLQNGMEIASHSDHKGREYGTVTFAAPVVVDGQRGNMAVVVKQTTDNTYKVHRILTPDGSVFNLSDINVEAESTPAGESPKNGSLATPINSASDTSIPASSQNVNGDDATLGMQSAPSGDGAMSKTYTNSGVNSQDVDMANAYRGEMENHPLAAEYEVKHDADVKKTAEQRTATIDQVNAEADYLANKTDWTSEDNLTAELAISALMRDGGEGAAERISSLMEQRKQENVRAGQLIESNSIIGTMEAADSPRTALGAFFDAFTALDEKETVYNAKTAGKDFKTWRKDIIDAVAKMAIEVGKVEDGDTESMKAIIRDIARERSTTGKNGKLPKTADSVLNKLPFSDLKKIADTQIVAMADDFRRRTAGEVLGSIRKSSILTALTTFERNIAGNATGGLLDSASESTTGRIADGILSKFTGKKTIGNDLRQVSAYVKGAKDATAFASLCVELNIPIETDATTALNTAFGGENGGKYVGKTFRPNGNIGMRALYAYQKFLSYNLEVTDKVFEGGTESAVSASLAKLKDSGLSPEEVQRLSEFTGKKRTFKDATWKDIEGNTHGALASRGANALKNAPTNIAKNLSGGDKNSVLTKVGKGVQFAVDTAVDYRVPFLSVATNLAQVGSDYTPVGIVKSLGEIAAIVIDSKNGVDIPVERQRQAASDFGRGASGLALVGAAAVLSRAGVIIVTDWSDRDKEALAESENHSGAQINWNGLYRLVKGEDATYQKGDYATSLDFLDPYNTQLYLGAEIANEDSFLSAVKNYPINAFTASMNAFMDSPMMSGLQEMVEDVSDVLGSESPLSEAGDVLAKDAGGYVGSYIPGIVRQIAQDTDGYYRDTRGETALEKAWNQVKAALPGASKTLPVKINGLGEEQERPGFVQTFLDPGKTSQIQKSDISSYLDVLSAQTGDASFYPDYQAPMSITIDGEKMSLDGGQRVTYQTAYGKTYAELLTGLIQSDDFLKLSPQEQAELANKARSVATQAAKSSVTDSVSAPEDTAVSLLNGKLVSNLSNAYSGLSTSWKSSTDDTTALGDMENAYLLYSSMSDETRSAVLEDLSSTIQNYISFREAGGSSKDYASIYKPVVIGENAIKSIQAAFKAGEVVSSDTLADMDRAYDLYKSVSPVQKETILENANSATSSMLQAMSRGVKGQTFTDLYKTYSEINNQDDLTAAEKANEWAYALEKANASGQLTRSQAATLKEDMQYFTIFPAEATKFNAMTEAGMSAESAEKVVKLLDGLTGTGANGSVRYIDKYTAIAGSSLSTKDKETAFLEYAPDAMDEKYTYAKENMGLTIDDFVNAYKVTDKYSKKKEQTAAWIAMGYTEAEAENLWKLYNGKLT